jgi:uncharacterized repeat protein (TIGR01451 family)
VVVDNNQLTLYQISEPLTSTSSATQANPYPFGTDLNGNRLNDPIPDTIFDPATLTVISPPAAGASALLDKLTINKPDLGDQIQAEISATGEVSGGAQFAYRLSISNNSGTALNGVQAVLTLPAGAVFVGATDGSAIVDGLNVIVTIGRLAPGSVDAVQITVQAPASGSKHLLARGSFRSATALPVEAGAVNTNVN